MGVLEATPALGFDGGESSPLTESTMTARRTETWNIITSPGTALREVQDSALIPGIKSPHPDGSLYRIVDRHFSQRSPILWRGELQYESPQLSLPTHNNEQPQSPLASPPDIRFDSEDVPEELHIEAPGAEGETRRPVLMVTGEEFNPRIMEVVPTQVIHIEKNVPLMNPALLQSLRNKVNSKPFWGMPAGTCWMRKLSAANVNSPDWRYWRLVAEILVREGKDNGGVPDFMAWYKRVRAQGYLVTATVTGVPVPVTAHAVAQGQRVNQPVLHRIYGPDGPPANYQPNAVFGGAAGNALGERIKDNAKAQFYYWRSKTPVDFDQLKLLEGFNQ